MLAEVKMFYNILLNEELIELAMVANLFYVLF